jgi:thioredoxin
MPTFMVFRGGEPVLKLVGARPKRGFVAELEAVL